MILEAFPTLQIWQNHFFLKFGWCTHTLSEGDHTYVTSPRRGKKNLIDARCVTT